MKKVLILALGLLNYFFAFAQQKLVLGVDLSTAEQLLEDNCQSLGYVEGDNFYEFNPYQIFRWEGADVIRLRVFVNPLNENGSVNAVIDACKKIEKTSGDRPIKVLIDFHYSDTWADPKGQWMPSAWRNSPNRFNWTWVGNKIYNHTKNTLNRIKSETKVDIAYVQIGNETDTAICDLKFAGDISWDSINRLSAMLKRASQGVKDSNASSAKIIIHNSRPDLLTDWFNRLTGFNNNYTLKKEQVDIIGTSYYPTFQKIKKKISLDNLENYIRNTRRDTEKEVMILETAFPFTASFKDDLPNNIDSGLINTSNNYNVSVDNQYRWYNELSRVAAKAGALGVFSWEPGWVASSTNSVCTSVPEGTSEVLKTEGQKLEDGSSMENCAFFDFDGGVIRNGGFKWLNSNKVEGYTRDTWNGNKSLSIAKTNSTYNTPKITIKNKTLKIVNSSVINNIEIYTTNGKKVFTRNNVNNDGIIDVSLSNWCKGIYILKIYNSISNNVIKFII